MAHEAVDQRFENQLHYCMCFVELSNWHVNCICVLILHVSSMQIVRLSSQDVPTAYAFELEAATIVQPEEVVKAVQRVVSGAPVLA